MKLLKTKHGILLSIYLLLMSLLYLGYLLLDNYRLNKSVHWLSKNNLTQADVKSINQLGVWTSNFEFVFLSLFMIAMCISIFGYKKNIEKIKHFLIVNAALFIGIVLISMVLLQITQLPIGNLTQPIVIPTCILGGFVIFMFWVSKKQRLVE